MNRRSFVSSSILGTAAIALGEQLAKPASAAQKSLTSDKVVHELPVIMEYTVLPSSLTARAWVEPGFRDKLVSAPNEILQSTPMKVMPWPKHISFKIHEDTEQIQHFTLPLLKSYFQEMPEYELMARLRHETLGETALEFFLPVDVIWTAWFDTSYRTLLLTDANRALSMRGYAPQRAIKVHANEPGAYHLALKVTPLDVDALTLESARARYIELMAMAGSSQCCASGTCDIDVPARG